MISRLSNNAMSCVPPDFSSLGKLEKKPGYEHNELNWAGFNMSLVNILTIYLRRNNIGLTPIVNNMNRL
jgi:hypothetical protein